MADYYRAYAKIKLDAINRNFDALKSQVTDGAKIMAVVKADAYGHGSVRVASMLKDKADYFAVATLSEGVELRQAGIETPILILGYTSPMEYEQLFEYNIIPTVYNCDEAALLNETAAGLGKKVTVHIAVDTGMSRIGFRDNEEGIRCIKSVSLLENVVIEGIFSHYATADMEDKSFCNEQKARFDRFLSMLEKENIVIPVKHMSNSAATIEVDEKYDMVRLGIALYGLYPSDEVDKTKVKLTPAMEVASHIIHVKEIEAGTGVGYGRAYVADSTRTIATIAIGYADGFKRCLTGKGYVLINGRRASLVGKVCMDQIMVDVTDIPDVKPGDKAIILGRSGDEEITAEDFGALCHSFSYEIICTFMPRVNRVYETGADL